MKIMKKGIIIIAALAIVSCQNDSELKLELNENSGNIPFTFNAFSNKATKANSTSLNDFYTTFNVYGWKSFDNGTTWETTNPVFNNVTNEYFAADGNGTVVYATGDPVSTEWGTIQSPSAFPGWYYENIRYWDKYATNYQFSAYTPITASAEVTCTPDGKILIGTDGSKVTVDNTNLMAAPNTALAYTGFLKDYMTAKSNVKTSAVNLVFSHELSKINVKLVLNTSVTTPQDVIVKEVSIKHLKGTSYYDSSNESATGYLTGWKTPVDELAYTVKGVSGAETGYKMNGTTAGTDKFSGYYVMERLMIPQTIEKNTAKADQLADMTQACVYVEYTIGDQTYKGHYALANLFIGTGAETTYDFLGGNEYTLTINVGPTPIYFTTEVTAWTNHDATDLIAN